MPVFHIEIDEIYKTQPVEIFLLKFRGFNHSVGIGNRPYKPGYALPRENIDYFADR